MKKTLVTILVVIALVLALGVAGFFGYIWYRDNHVFVDGDAYDISLQSLDLTQEDISVRYYDELRQKLTEYHLFPFPVIAHVNASTTILSVR